MLILLLIDLSLADSLHDNGYPELAVIEYQREFYFRPEVYKQKEKRLCYALDLLKTNGIKGIDEVNKMRNEFTDLDQGSRTALAWQFIDIGFYSSAEDFLTAPEQKKLLGYVHLLNGNILRAKEIFETGNEAELARETADFLARPKKSITKAMLLSTFFPGAGEIYAGNMKLGIFDFILSWGSGYLTYDALRDKRYMDAGLIFSFLFNRFWLGSISNAGRVAAERNEATQEKWLKQIKYKYFILHQ